MEIEAQKTYAKLEKYYWWFLGRRIIIRSVLNKFIFSRIEILDWGCGGGGNYNMLNDFGNVLGVDSSELNIKISKERGIKNVLKLNKIDQLHKSKRFDLITCFDVLEHIKEDKKYLLELKQLLHNDGCVLVTVPAYKFMWTNLDNLLGHHRRYGRKELMKIFEESGYKILKTSYFYTTISPIFILLRMYQKLSGRATSLENHAIKVPEIVNKFLIFTLVIESKILDYFNLPFGTSIILLAKKFVIKK